jgi:Radical SAM superfamily
MSLQTKFTNCRTELEKTSPTYCLAKWLQVTIHLHSGTNHSCHHPKVHKIPLEELAANPSALHNTAFKKDQRRLMLAGERPPECEYCWAVEDLGKSHFSDRIMKSSEDWAWSRRHHALEMGADGNAFPSYVEVSFSNACNFKCSYCSASFSTKWREELKEFGPYATGSGNLTCEPIEEEINPYVDAFWRWWPELRKNLHTFRITGGEPLLAKSTFRLLEELVAEPLPNLSLAVNSNLGVHAGIVQRLQRYLDRLMQPGHLKDFTLFTSIDGWGAQAEYMRHGLNLELFRSNLELLLGSNPGIRGVVMCTFNALSLPSFQALLENVLNLRRRFQTSVWICPLLIDVSLLRYPTYQSAQILPKDFLRYLENSLAFMEENKNDPQTRIFGFYEHEIMKMKRTIEWMRSPLPEEDLARRRREFVVFFKEHDRRRGTSLVSTFPELREFWAACGGTLGD